MNKPKLYIMCGISASGKSTIAKQIAKKDNCVIVSSDAIREEICEGGISDQSKNEEVFKIFHKRIKENLLKGNNVIADATNITIKSRKAIFNTVKGIDCDKIAYIIVKGVQDCIKDNMNNDRIPVSNYVIQKQVGKFQIPFYEEGFDNILIIDEQNKPKYDIFYHVKLLQKTKNFNQHNPYHSQTLDQHLYYVHDCFCTMYKNYPFCYKQAALYHDIGKLICQTFDENGIGHYYGHESFGTYELLCNKDNLLFSGLLEHELLDFLFLINYHMLPNNWNTEKTKNKYRNIFGDYKYKLLTDFNICDKMRP